MINLLPETAKKDIRAARSNVTLLHYIVILWLGVAFLALICTGVYFVLSTSKTDAERLISVNKTKSSAYTSVQAQGAALRAGLSTAKTILDQEVVYTKIITGIAALMPSGVVLEGINLSPNTIGTPITLQFVAKTTADALKLKDNFQASQLFTNVSFQSLSSGGGDKASYPVSATLNVTINKSATR